MKSWGCCNRRFNHTWSRPPRIFEQEKMLGVSHGIWKSWSCLSCSHKHCLSLNLCNLVSRVCRGWLKMQSPRRIRRRPEVCFKIVKVLWMIHAFLVASFQYVQGTLDLRKKMLPTGDVRLRIHVCKHWHCHTFPVGKENEANESPDVLQRSATVTSLYL